MPELVSICSIEGCYRSHSAKGYCVAHYRRLIHGYDLSKPLREARNVVYSVGATCANGGCEKRPRSKGLCERCYANHLYRQKSGCDLPALHAKQWWKNIGYAAAHHRVKVQWGSARQYTCVLCDNPGRAWAYDGTDPSQLYGKVNPKKTEQMAYYSRFPEFYMPLCQTCHTRRDGATSSAELREYREWKQRTGLTLADVG